MSQERHNHTLRLNILIFFFRKKLVLKAVEKARFLEISSFFFSDTCVLMNYSFVFHTPSGKASCSHLSRKRLPGPLFHQHRVSTLSFVVKTKLNICSPHCVWENTGLFLFKKYPVLHLEAHHKTSIFAFIFWNRVNFQKLDPRRT